MPTVHTLPVLAVFDLDACLWDQEMFEMTEMPSGPVKGELRAAGVGVVGVKCGRRIIRLHPGALLALQEYHAGAYPGMTIAAASSADTPFAVKVGRKTLTILEVVPGVSVWEVFAKGREDDGNMQIGRTPPLSSDKAATHFPILRQNTGVPYDKMLFFDDCNWGDHCGKVERGCTEDTGLGPVTVRTPFGLQESDWLLGLKKYAEKVMKLS